MHRHLLAACLLLALPAVAPAQGRGGSGAETVTLLVPARVWDGSVDKKGVANKPHEGWAILVRGERITAVGPRDQLNLPAGATTVELPGTTHPPGADRRSLAPAAPPVQRGGVGRPGAP